MNNDENFENKLNAIYDILKDEPFDVTRTILIGHLQRIISDQNDENIYHHIKFVADDLYYRIMRIKEMEECMQSNKQMSEPCSPKWEEYK